MRHRILAALSTLMMLPGAMLVAGGVGSGRAAPTLGHIGSWGYQLQALDIDALAGSTFDMLVIDHSKDGSIEQRLSPGEVNRLKVKPNGAPRIVLSYLSIGEAEDYRVYWRQEWDSAPPSWLGRENPEWPGNFAVRYWDPEWKKLIFGEPGSFLDVILKQGFDGVYLDKVDGFFDWPEDPQAIPAIKAFIAEIAAYAKAIDPDFLIVQQNAEELMDDPAHVAVIDGLAKEDLFFGVDGDGIRNDPEMVEWSLAMICRLQAADNKLVIIVEYALTLEDAARARAEAAELGIPITIARRELDELPQPFN